MPGTFYCSMKYRDAKHGSECDQDPLCERKAFEYECSARGSDFKGVVGMIEVRARSE